MSHQAFKPLWLSRIGPSRAQVVLNQPCIYLTWRLTRKGTINLLSIDGGFTGLAALYFLDEVFYRLRVKLQLEEELRPCDWFDMIIGCGGGGLAAILLGKLQMTTPDAIKAYRKLERYMTRGSSRPPIDKLLDENGKFEQELKAILRSKTIPTSIPMQSGPKETPDPCQTIICTRNNASLRLIHSYEPSKRRMPSCTVVQAAKATIASRYISGPITISESYQLYLEDGSSICPNPALELIEAATEKMPGEKRVCALISIGGRFSGTSASPNNQESEATKTHHRLQRQLGSENMYFRFVTPYKTALGREDQTLEDDIRKYTEQDAVDTLINRLVEEKLPGKGQRPLSSFFSLCQRKLRLAAWEVEPEDQKPSDNDLLLINHLNEISIQDDDDVSFIPSLTAPSAHCLWAEMNTTLAEERANLERLEENLTENSEELLISLNTVASLCHDLGMHDDALRYAIKTKNLLIGSQGDEETPEFLNSANTVAFYMAENGDHIAARDLARAIVEKQKGHRLLGPEHPDTLSGVVTLLAINWHLSQYNAIINSAENIIKTCQRTQFAHLPDVLDRKNKITEFNAANLRAKCLWALGRHKEAVKYGLEVASLGKTLFQAKDPNVFIARSNLMLYFTFNRNHTYALEEERAIMDDCIHILGEQHPVAINFRANLALRYSHLGRTGDALQVGEEVVKLRRNLLGREHPETLLARSYNAMYLSDAGKYAEALTLEKYVLQSFQKTLKEDHPYTISALNNLAIYYCKMGNYSEALHNSQRALSWREAVLGEDHIHTKETRRQVAEYRDMNQDSAYEEPEEIPMKRRRLE